VWGIGLLLFIFKAKYLGPDGVSQLPVIGIVRSFGNILLFEARPAV